MTEWTLLKRLLDAVHQHSTMIGRLWLTVMVIFRLLVVAVATEDVYADEQTMFVCNTLQPGCATVCYDAFAPISQPRFWVFHIISVSTPSLCFIVYTWHNLSKLPPATAARGAPGGRAEPGEGEGPRENGGGGGGREAFERSCDSSDSCSVRSHRHLGHSLADVLEGGGGGQSPQGRGGGAAASLTRARARVRRGRRGTGGGGVLSKYYVFHVWLRAVLEVGFVLAQWLLFGFEVPTRFLCAAVAPCGQPVDCYVSRPTEKTVFLLFMFCVGVLCILLNLLELNHLGWKKVRRVLRERGGSWGGGRPGKRRGGYETFAPSPGSPSPTSSSLGFRDVTSTASLPALGLVVEHRPDWTCAGNCSPFPGTTGGGPGGGVRPPKSQDPRIGERQPLKGKRGHKQRSTEVWI